MCIKDSIGAAPVGDDGPVEAPVLPQDVLQEMGVLVGVGAVDEVVGLSLIHISNSASVT